MGRAATAQWIAVSAAGVAAISVVLAFEGLGGSVVDFLVMISPLLAVAAFIVSAFSLIYHRGARGWVAIGLSCLVLWFWAAWISANY